MQPRLFPNKGYHKGQVIKVRILLNPYTSNFLCVVASFGDMFVSGKISFPVSYAYGTSTKTDLIIASDFNPCYTTHTF